MTATVEPIAALRHARTRACTILLVDDEPANLDLLEALLSGEGYTSLLRASDPRVVPSLVEAHAPDLVLLDLHMPHRHGLDVLADLAELTPAGDYRPVLVLTADVTADARDRALALGARDFVTKPFDTTEVVLRVQNLLDTRVLYLAEREARVRVEQAEMRAALLATWSRILASVIDPRQAITHLPRLLLPRWTSACAMGVGLEPGEKIDWIGADSGSDVDAASLETVARVVVESPTIARDEAMFVSPIITRDGVVGALVVARTASASGMDQTLLNELAARLALAVEHARLLASAELAVTERERLLAVVAHDLRNPLGAVSMYAEMLANLQPSPDDDAPSPPDAETRRFAHSAVQTIHRNAAAMQHLVEDLLDASTLRASAMRIHRSPVDVEPLIDDLHRMMRARADDAGVTLDMESDGPVGVVTLDGIRVRQLLSNLIGNAITFTPRGGEVRLRYAVASDTVTQHPVLRGSVSDTGPGIPADELPHLFTAFWRGDRRDRKGAGLGLWIANAICEAHGGDLRVETLVGAGSTFHFTLSLVDTSRRPED